MDLSLQPPFESFQKIPRLKRGMVITEKIDGTNAQIFINDDCTKMLAGSRNRWINPEQDNAGFARWAQDHIEELYGLGPGRHFGEWWGQGIQRRYGLSEKRFSLFNTGRWTNDTSPPACCSVVPVLFAGEFTTINIDITLDYLRRNGSVAAPGFMEPEGIVVFHPQSKQLFKVTLDDDAVPKSLADRAKTLGMNPRIVRDPRECSSECTGRCGGCTYAERHP